MKYLLDTNMCIYIIKKHPPRVFEKLKSLDIEDVGISAITAAELEYGVSKSSMPEKNRLALTKFTAPLQILPFEEKAAEAYGRLGASLEKTGTVIGSFDLLIGAQAKSENLILVTNNVSEFGGIPGLKLENWF
jgi:tRNA(fMet)-specific endonuclease VapC